MHLNSRLLFEAHAARYFRAGDRVLEIGADAMPSTYRQVLGGMELDWRYADLGSELDETTRRPRFASGPSTTPDVIMSSPYELPVADGSFDVVVAGQVMEHVPAVWRWVCEVARIVRVDGLVVLIAPVSWPFHEAPVDCWRVYPAGMEALLAEAGVQPLICEWGSLEHRDARRRHPGETRPPSRELAWRKRVGLSVEASFDTIAVGRKVG